MRQSLLGYRESENMRARDNYEQARAVVEASEKTMRKRKRVEEEEREEYLGLRKEREMLESEYGVRYDESKEVIYPKKWMKTGWWNRKQLGEVEEEKRKWREGIDLCAEAKARLDSCVQKSLLSEKEVVAVKWRLDKRKERLDKTEKRLRKE